MADFEAVKSSLEGFLKSPGSMAFLGGQHEAFTRVTRFMLQQVSAWLRGVEAYSCPQEVKTDLLRALTFLIERRILDPLGEDAARFTWQFAELVQNFNSQVRDEAIARKLQMLINVLRAHETLAGVIQVGREILRRMQRMIQFEPPAFKLSRHYLEELMRREREYESNGKGDGTKPGAGAVSSPRGEREPAASTSANTSTSTSTSTSTNTSAGT